jgi:hypothetical protein
MIQPNGTGELARGLAGNGEESKRWAANKHKVAIRTELGAIEQLSERIALQCNAQARLSEMVAGYQYDDDSLRAIRLAVNSIGEALDNVERLCAIIDQEEFGQVGPQAHCRPDAVKHGNDLAAVEEIINDLSVQANAEAYVLGLVASRRRPAPATVAAMKLLFGSVRAILG